VTKLENINQRLEKLEHSNNQEILTLVEILANANFFGEMKKALCKYAKNGQCSLFIVDSKTESKLPLATPCRINGCKEESRHCHIELSCITCSLCHEAETSVDSSEIIEQKTDNLYQKKQTIKGR
jgi:hypothetical protein